MPNWLIPIVLKLIASEITPEHVKGLEKEFLMMVERAVKDNPAAVAIVAALAGALGIKLDPV